MINHTLVTSSLTVDYEMRHLVTGRSAVGIGREGTFAPINLYYMLRQAFQLLSILLTWRPRIVHLSITCGLAFWKESLFMLLGRAFGARVIAHVHGSKLDEQIVRSSQYARKAMGAALHVPHVVVVLSAYWRSLLLEHISLSLPIMVVPNSVDPAIAMAMEDQPLEREGNMVLFVGSLCRRKGVPDALQAVASVRQQVPEAHFVFVGPPETDRERSFMDPLCREAEKSGGVSFPGLVTGAAKIQLFARASVFILPSYNENFPISLLEAMAMGLPVVATPVAGVVDMVQDGFNGFLVQPGDCQALTERIVRLLQDLQLRLTMGRANRDKVRRAYSPAMFAASINRLYSELLIAAPDSAPTHA